MLKRPDSRLAGEGHVVIVVVGGVRGRLRRTSSKSGVAELTLKRRCQRGSGYLS